MASNNDLFPGIKVVGLEIGDLVELPTDASVEKRQRSNVIPVVPTKDIEDLSTSIEGLSVYDVDNEFSSLDPDLSDNHVETILGCSYQSHLEVQTVSTTVQYTNPTQIITLSADPPGGIISGQFILALDMSTLGGKLRGGIGC